MEVCNILLKKSNTESTCKQRNGNTMKKMSLVVKMLCVIQPLDNKIK